jgi:hypothetical protein
MMIMHQDMPFIVAWMLAAVFAGLGVLMFIWRPGPRWWIGVRTPWTYADREIWDHSWTQAAILLLLMAVAVLISWMFLVAALIFLIIWCLTIPLLYYRQKYGTLHFWKDHGWIDYRPVARCRHCGHFQKLDNAAELDRRTCEACGGRLSG